MMSNRRAGREFLSVEESERPLQPMLYRAAADNYMVAVSEQGRMLLFQIAEMKHMARGRGVIIMGLEKGEKLVAAAVSNQRTVTVFGIARGNKEREVTIAEKDMGHYAGHRARMGRVLPDKLKPQTLRIALPDA